MMTRYSFYDRGEISLNLYSELARLLSEMRSPAVYVHILIIATHCGVSPHVNRFSQQHTYFSLSAEAGECVVLILSQGIKGSV